MDVSKLPRLSKTDTPTNDADQPAGEQPPGAAAAGAWCPNCGAPLAARSQFCAACGARLSGASRPPGMGFETWLSIGMGLFLLFIAPTGIRYWSTTLTGGEFKPYDHPENVGEKVDFTRWVDTSTGAVTDIRYQESIEFWSDTAVTAFAVVLILNGLVIAFVRKPAVLAIALFLTASATLLNFGYLVATFNQGFAMISFLAALFGAFMCYQQWQTLQAMRSLAPAAPVRG